MLQKYERKAEDILEKLAQEEPNERNFKMLAEALIIMAGGKIMGAMGGETSRYDGGRMDEYARGRERDIRRGSRGGYAYDGRPMMDDDAHEGEREYWDEDDDEEEYYNGRGVSRRNGRRRGARGRIRGGVKD